MINFRAVSGDLLLPYTEEDLEGLDRNLMQSPWERQFTYAQVNLESCVWFIPPPKCP